MEFDQRSTDRLPFHDPDEAGQAHTGATASSRDVELTRDGYTVARNATSFDVAAVHGVEVRPDGSLHGGADPGHHEMALAV
jgi:hypothetical protein